MHQVHRAAHSIRIRHLFTHKDKTIMKDSRFRNTPFPAQACPGRTSPADYGTYEFSSREKRRNILLYITLDLIVSWLFFRSIPAALLFLPGIRFFLRERREELLRRRRRVMLEQFTTGMQLVNASLQAGYAVENAFREALIELRRIYLPDDFIISEFQWIVSQTSLSVPIESLLIDLGRRSHIEEIQNFAEVFQTAKRTGGDLALIIRNTVSGIQGRTQTRQEIEADISGKVMEQNIMSMAPILIIGYVRLTSPGFMDPCYESAEGILIMTICLAVYVLAFLWGRKIMRIEV